LARVYLKQTLKSKFRSNQYHVGSNWDCHDVAVQLVIPRENNCALVCYGIFSRYSETATNSHQKVQHMQSAWNINTMLGVVVTVMMSQYNWLYHGRTIVHWFAMVHFHGIVKLRLTVIKKYNIYKLISHINTMLGVVVTVMMSQYNWLYHGRTIVHWFAMVYFHGIVKL
jgi:hypothetical protein